MKSFIIKENTYLLSMNPLEIPHLTHYVNDFSHTFSDGQIDTLDAIFSEHEKKTTEQVVTVFIPHREGNELLDIWLKAFDENGIGQKNLNNGLLLIVSTEEKKLRIIVGKGLELKYTEMVCRDIVENQLRPLLNAGKYEEMVRRWGEMVLGQLVFQNNSTESKALKGWQIFLWVIIWPPIFIGLMIAWVYAFYASIPIFILLGWIVALGISVYTIKKDWFSKSLQGIFLLWLTWVFLTTIGIYGTISLVQEIKCKVSSTCVYTSSISSQPIIGNWWWYDSHSDYSSSSDSSSSFDGWWGSSNGGGYGD